MRGAVAVRSGEAEREELLRAMASVVGERGYREASVAEVIAAAGSCRATFERHFADKEECFLAAQERLMERAFAEVSGQVDPEAPWQEQVRGGLQAAIALCRENPYPARAALVEAAAAGAEAQRRTQAALERFAGLVAAVETVPPRAALMAVSGIAALIGEELAHDDGAGLEGRLPELTFALLVPLLGPVVASEQMAGAGAR